MQLHITDIDCYAYHGCLKEEAAIGGHFSVSLTLTYDFTEAAQTDNLTQAIDYVLVHAEVRKQMAIRANLIEHVATRIKQSMQKLFPQCQNITVAVTKYNPPVNGHINKVTVTI
ncbi:MAG: dihydroneopterin aldolase [Bacteroidia bacterium]|mgnify:CR=1 FL=1|nr:dihydroneopterin aldolase [Bacteroidia bacterium]HQV00511.1 dihydroneopterin aldolase [Bacteroidia bacterium]